MMQAPSAKVSRRTMRERVQGFGRLQRANGGCSGFRDCDYLLDDSFINVDGVQCYEKREVGSQLHP